MIDTAKKSALAVLFFVIGMVTFAVAPALAEPGQNETATAAGKEQSGLAVVKAGPLEITPGHATLRIEGKTGQGTCFFPTVRFKVKNSSSADVRIILFAKSIQVTDELGYHWFRDGLMKSGGVPLSDYPPEEYAQSFTKEKGKFVTLSPQQVFETQILQDGVGGAVCFRDAGDELVQTHRPKTTDFSANIGIISLDNSTDIRAFSFSDMPVTQVSAR